MNIDGVKRAGILAGLAVALAWSAAPALAQQSGSSGTTSGPAAGSPTTLGTGGVVPASPHQTQDTKSSGGSSIKGETSGQAGGTAQGTAGATGTESGKTAKPQSGSGSE